MRDSGWYLEDDFPTGIQLTDQEISDNHYLSLNDEYDKLERNYGA